MVSSVIFNLFATMKVCVTFLLFSIVAAASSANALLSAVNYEGTVESLIKQAETVSVQVAKLLEHQFKKIAVEPINTVDAAIQKIEDRRAENADCVAAKDPDVELVVDTLHGDMFSCGTIAAEESAEIAIDVNTAVQQIVFDGYKILRLNQKCKNYKNSILKSSCYTKLTIQTTLYIKNARKSIKTIKGANQRILPVFAKADKCTHNSAEEAGAKLDSINNEIDLCIKQNI